jgi:RNA polymerase sigma-70 factor, ECF subfamily
MGELARAFLEVLPEPLRGRFVDGEDLERRLATIAAEAGLGLAARDVVVSLATRLSARPDEVVGVGVLQDVHAQDLGLAIACERGAAAALREFDRRFGPDMDRAIARSPNLGVGADEFRQIVREKLFVAVGDASGASGEGAVASPSGKRIAGWSGRAPLAGWVRVVCARTVVDLARRHEDREELAGDDALFERLRSADDPELAALRRRFADLLPAAFRAGLAALTPRQRNLLRQRYLHGVAASAIAAAHGVHRATAFGWIEEARQALLSGARRHLAESARGAALESVVDLLGSELHVSLGRLLGAEAEGE